MSHRCLASMGVLAAVIVVVSLAPGPAAAQAPTVGATTWTPPRTPDGQPDLQGIWDNNTSTPLERPNKFAGKQVLTDDEQAEAEKRALASSNKRDAPEVLAEEKRRQLVRAYNAFWSPGPGRLIARTSLVVDPPDGRVPPLTPGARKRFAAWAEARGLFASAASPEGSLWNGGPGNQRFGRIGGSGEIEDGTEGGVDGRGSRADGPEDRRLSERCIIWSTLPRFPGGYNSNLRIAQTPGFVVIQMEMIHDARIIPLDGRPHLPQNIRQWLGDSRGRWEGDTLVIDSTNFTDKAPFKGSFEGLHLVERLTRVDATTLNYEVTVDDPTTWTKPWTAAWPLTTLSAGADRDAAGHELVTVPQMFEYACHEGNYGLAGQLRGTRAEEKAAQSR